MNKEQRRNQALQIRQNKRDELLSKKRSLGGMDFAPFLGRFIVKSKIVLLILSFAVCVIPLHKQMDIQNAVSILTQCDSDAIVNITSSGITHIW